MSIRNTHRQKYPRFGKKGDSPYKYYLNKDEIIQKKNKTMTDWDKEVKRAVERLEKRATERAMEAATAVIRKDGPENKPFCVYSEKTGRKFGCYSTRKQAEERLAQIEKFKHIKGDESK